MRYLVLLYIRLAKRWIRWFWHAKTRYDLHPPVAYRFAEAVLEDDRQFYAYSKIETLRILLKEDKRRIEMQDYGAGSLVNSSLERTIANIATHTPVLSSVGRQLFRIVNLYQPETVLELGGSLGISTSYLASARRESTIYTIEGSLEVYEQALRNWEWLKLNNIKPANATFEEALPQILSEIERLDLLFIDGDHRKGASLRYFEQCLSKTHDGSIFIIADIHWSDDMEKAWEWMKAHDAVRLSIDLFHIGVLFFNPDIKIKQDYCLVKSRWKPWRMGFW